MTEAVDNPEAREKIVQTVGVVIFNETHDKVLVIRHGIDSRVEIGKYGLPAGRVEEGESFRQAAAREQEEETGLVTDSADLIEFPGNKFGPTPVELRNRKAMMEWTVFISPKYTGEIRPEREVGAPEWVSVKELNLKYHTMENVLDAINNAQNFLEKGGKPAA